MINTIHVSVTDDQGHDITDQFNVLASSSPTQPPEPEPGPGETIERPIGLEYMVPGYERPEVPDNAIVWSEGEYEELEDAVEAAWLNDLPLYLDVPMEFSGDFGSMELPVGLFGVEGVIIRNTGGIGSGTPCGFYLIDGDSTIVGIEFIGFGTVFGMSTRSMSVERGYELPWDIHGSRRSSYGTLRCIDAGTVVSGDTKGVGLPLDYSVYPETTVTTGPAIWISDCKFTDCESVLFEWSDCIGIGRIDFHRNILTGTFGGFSPEGSWWTEVHAVNNVWRDCIDDREIPGGLKASRFSTFANLGTNAGIDVDVSRQVVQIFNNEASNIHCLVASDGTNAAVFLDARQCTPTEITNPDDPFTWWCTAECSFNRISDVLGIRGQEDSNAIYGKTRGFLVERNHIKNCGSHYYSEGSGDGAEATGTEFKQTANMEGQPEGAALVFRGNIFEDMPPKDKNKKLQAVMGTNDIGLRLWVIGNIFIRDHISNAEGNVPALIRHFGHALELKIMCNEFHECEIAEPASLIGFHAVEGNPGPNSEISNNTAYGAYDENTLLIYSSSGLSGAKVGLNMLVNDDDDMTYVMTANFGSPDGVIPRAYEPPTVEA
jgi:hypothetical protein